MNDKPQRLPWKGPTTAWASMCAVVGLVIADGLALNGETQWRLAFAGAAILVGGLAFGLAGALRLNPLQRLVAIAGWFFICLMAMLSFADILTRRG